jgi:hypothetical protein
MSESILPDQRVPDLPVWQLILIFQQCRLSNRVVAEYAFFWTTRIGCNDFFLAVRECVMCNFVFGDDNRLWFRNLLDNLRFHAERVSKLSSKVQDIDLS